MFVAKISDSAPSSRRTRWASKVWALTASRSTIVGIT